MILVGIHGKGGSGKDTVGHMLKENHGFATTSFALPIKQMVCELLHVPIEAWNDREWRETPLPLYGNKSPRYMAQTLGTEWGRNTVSRGLWYDLAISKIEQAHCQNEDLLNKFAITDVRFDDEAAKIRARNGFIIVVNRDSSDLHNSAKEHSSEEGLSSNPYDLHIYNNWDLKDLELQVMDAVEDIYEIRGEAA
jgi:hypothetical protein